MSDPHIAATNPFPVQVQQGKDYYWCACGRSKSQPLCDGSHKGTEFTPVRYTATATKTLYFCGCKHTGNRPLCDGTHSTL